MKCDRCGTEIYSNPYEYEDETVCQHCRGKDIAYEESLRDQYMDFMKYGRVEWTGKRECKSWKTE